ncbi:Glucosidase 2 subunit beta [Cyphellophora attinorum]|uniref:Glucosidase 2 subunit beta n=1 Tax=Cyphellophora attinorum TaxID=1664694 RepID=A0A0N0NIH0_9EURO|nr:Glucosidase 2 subunit beta [Phialophora attinorum]KPI35429.1 Glucosidase 2 subunit beta [Phialophora attinorum]
MIIRSEVLLLGVLYPLRSSAAETRSSDSRPRGVGPEFAKFFKPSAKDTFTCISNPSISIPFSRVNDDYCDCPDGSDEPGTAACSFLSPYSPPQYHPGPDTVAAATLNSSLALPGFYCKNKGHVPSYIRFESVNDGRCDYDVCCDGSDEFGGVGGIKCPDKCNEIGKEYRKHEEIRQKTLQGALKRKKELATQANTAKQEVQNAINMLQIKMEAVKVKVKDAETNLADVEHREKMRIVRGGSAPGGGKLPILVNLAQERIKELRSSLEKTKSQRDSMSARVIELEGLLTKLKEDRNPNFNDAGVKAAVQGWEDYAARETTDSWSDAEDRDLAAIMAEDSDSNGINWAEFQSDDSSDSDVAALYSFTSYLPPGVSSWIDTKVASIRQLLIENGVLPSKTTDVGESKAVQEAKKSVDAAGQSLSDAERNLSKHQEDLDKDYGPEGIFRALKDTCITKDSGEYTYELCFMGKTQQKPRKGGSGTTMGNFVGFDVEEVDDDVGLDGKGLGRGERVVMKYENGQHCWNGPNRSTRVVLACAKEDEIWKISESEKCVYRMEVGTAAVCHATRDGNKAVEMLPLVVTVLRGITSCRGWCWAIV